MQSKQEFELRLVEMVKSLPDYTEGHPCFTASKNPVCNALNYKIGMGLSGTSLLELYDKVSPMRHMFSSFTRMNFDIERDVDSPYYGKTYLSFGHLHLKSGLNPHTRISIDPDLSKASGVDLTVLAVIYEGDKRAVIVRPHWEGEVPFALPFKLLHQIRDRSSDISINHRECTHELIDQIKKDDILTLPHQMPKQG